MLLLEVILDRSVGGERTLMSMAVPRRMGTRGGVSSREMSGLDDCESELRSGSVPRAKASIKPGLTTMLHSSGSNVSQLPLLDQANTDAIALEVLEGCRGTVR